MPLPYPTTGSPVDLRLSEKIHRLGHDVSCDGYQSSSFGIWPPFSASF